MEQQPEEVTPDPATEPEGATDQPEESQDTRAEGDTDQAPASEEVEKEEEVQDEE